MPPSNWLVFDRIREFARSNRIFQQERILQDQSSIDRITVGGEFLNFSSQSAILEQTNLQINRLERYKDYEQMDQTGEVSLALDLYSDECSMIDPEHKHSLIIRADDRKIKEELEELYYETLMTDRIIRPAARYLCKTGDCPWEIVTDQHRSGVSSLRFMNVYNFTRIETRFGDLIGFFYQDDIYPEPIFLQPWACMHLRLTILENTYNPYGRCVRFGTKVLTPSGYKNIEDFQEGDDVYCFDDEKLVPTRVIAACHSGQKQIYRIATNNFTINVSANHPVLCVRDGQTLYVRADDLAVGDNIVAAQPTYIESDIKIEAEYDYVKFNDNFMSAYDAADIGHKKASKLIGIPADYVRGFILRGKSIPRALAAQICAFYGFDDSAMLPGKYGTQITPTLPDKIDENFSRLFGFLLGDGWTSPNAVEIALGDDDEINEEYIGLLELYGNTKCTIRRDDRSKPVAAILNNKTLAKLMRKMGLVGKCYEKSVPSWAYNLSANLKVNFVQGYLDADGCAYFDRDTFTLRGSSSSFELIHGMRLLILSLGHRVSNIYEKMNNKFGILEEKTRPIYSLSFYQSHLGYIDGVATSRIKSIVVDGEHPTADIQVDHPASNFVADGIVVHNSVLDGGRKAFKQLRLMEDAALIYRICLTGDSRIWTIDGYKFIKDLREGDLTYYYGEDGLLHTTKVTNQVCNGKRDVYKVSTKHRDLCGTATHPFLVKNIYTNIIEYVDLRDLNPEQHLVVTPRVNGEGVEKILTLWSDNLYAKLTPELENDFRSTNYENITAHMRVVEHPVYLTRQFLYLNKGMPSDKAGQLCDILGLDRTKLDVYTPGVRGGSTLPPTVTSEFARFIGFYFGDGYVTETNWRVGLALESNHSINQAYTDLFRKYHKRVKLEYKREGKIKRLNTAVVCDKQFYHTCIALGLGGGAHGKRVPGWVFRLPLGHKIEFLMGFIDADGSEHGGDEYDYYTVELCNRDLLEDLKVLCDQVGWKTGKIGSRTRPGGLDHMKGEYTSYSLFINPSFGCGFEKITDITYAGQDDVYDITVEHDAHNFIANGMAVHNTRAPEKRKYKIPVGLIPPKEVPEYMQMIARMFKRQRFYNPSTGSFDERYSPMVQEDDFFLPQRPDGSGPDIDVLPGAENLDQIADIEYFKKKMIAPLKIPFSRVGIGEGAGEPNEKSLSQSHSEFAKAVKWIQSEIALGFTKVGIVHLALRGYPAEALKGFELHLAASSAIEDLYRMETWQTRTAVMADLKDIGWFPKEWIVTRFTDLSPDEIQELEEMEDSETGGGVGGVGGVGGMGGGGDMGDMGEDMEDIKDMGDNEDTEDLMDDAEEELPEGMENFDKIDKPLLLEMARDERKSKSAAYVRKMYDKKNAIVASCFNHILEHKELDGLSSAPPPADVLTEAWRHEPEDENVLVEWSVPRKIREEAITEIATVLRGGSAPISDSDEITDADLPDQMV